MTTARSTWKLGVALAAFVAAACSGGSTARDGPSAQGIAVTITPDSATLVAGSQLAFTASVSGTADPSTTWSIAEGEAGGSISAEGLYTAPASAGSYHVVATSAASPQSAATATVTVTASSPQVVTVSVSPSAVTISAGASQPFSCEVSGSGDTSCTWTVQEGASGGAVTSSGVYTAPQKAGTYHVVAASHADPTQLAVAAVTVAAPAPLPVGVAVSPLATTVSTGTSQAFTCTVAGSTNTSCTWSVQEGTAGGRVTSAGVYTAPQAAGTYHVVAKSSADATKSATATVTVTAPPVVSVSLAPSTASVDACQTRTFTVSVTGTSNSAVTWSVQEGASGGTVTSGGVYRAPATAGTYRVVATSQVDSTKSGVATVTVGAEKVLSVAVNPQQASAQTGGTVQFTATVTTTCGTFTQTQAVAANGALAN